jgi:hypothetical protein
MYGVFIVGLAVLVCSGWQGHSLYGIFDRVKENVVIFFCVHVF